MNIRDNTLAASIDAVTVKQALKGKEEVAFIDVREEGEHGLGHPLLSVNIPYSRLEAEFALRVPRRSTHIVLLGDQLGSGDKAALRLHYLGYRNVHVLAGGANGWTDAGYELFDGTNVPSKAFAEILEIEAQTPHVTADELVEIRKSGVDHVLLDSRTPEEFGRFHVPGARSAPGVELVYRAESLIPSEDTLVVVSCAGRTRSIIGAQALINAGIPNKVVSLAGGTQGWRLAGFDLESSPASPLPQTAADSLTLERAAALRSKYRIGSIGLAEVQTLQAKADGPSIFVFDVRTRTEYDEGHVAGARWVSGGQLVQALDNWVGVRKARIVVADDDGVRATVAAHWLKQLGWDVDILTVPANDKSLVSGVSPNVSVDHLPIVVGLETGDVQAWLHDGGRIVSADLSADYRKAHPHGAAWANRSRLDRLPQEVLRAGRILVVGSNSVLTTLLADEIARTSPSDVRVLHGDADIWRLAGLDVMSSTLPADADRIDYLFWNHFRHDGDHSAMQAYLQWELDLPPRIEADGTAGFRIQL